MLFYFTLVNLLIVLRIEHFFEILNIVKGNRLNHTLFRNIFRFFNDNISFFRVNIIIFRRSIRVFYIYTIFFKFSLDFIQRFWGCRKAFSILLIFTFIV